MRLSKIFFLLIVWLVTVTTSQASFVSDFKTRHPLYLGIMGGYGSTTWGALVPKSQSAMMSLSVPMRVSEGGGLWGVYAGYEFLRQFALEANYIRFPNAKLIFDPLSLFTFDNNGMTQLITRAETVTLMAKFLLPIGHSKFRAYSSAGLAEVHRYDTIRNIWRGSPAFGVGLNYSITDHWEALLATNYIAGYGQAEIDPTKSFVPFLYSMYLGLAYRV